MPPGLLHALLHDLGDAGAPLHLSAAGILANLLWLGCLPDHPREKRYTAIARRTLTGVPVAATLIR